MYKTIKGIRMTLTFSYNRENVIVHNQKVFDTDGGGVYAVVIDNVIKYIGKYGNTLQRRWVNLEKNKNCIKRDRHFKYYTLLEDANGGQVDVFCITENKISQTYNNDLINYCGIEQYLIDKIQPQFNKIGVR